MTNRRTFMKSVGAAAVASGTGARLSFAKEGDAFDEIPRISLTRLPTSCNKMENVTKLVGGPDLYIKRDDVMELAHGGNKTRKLEYALAQALNNGAKAVVTQGGLQSNHVRQTCSGAAKVGLEAHVILSNPVPEMKAQLMGSGNFLMDQLMGAHIYIAEDGRGPVVDKVLADLTEAGKNPYNIPAGASNGIGSLGYMNAARELIGQWDEMGISPSHIFTATGSCGTQAGLLMGLRYFGNTTTMVVGISVSAPRYGHRQGFHRRHRYRCLRRLSWRWLRPAHGGRYCCDSNRRRKRRRYSRPGVYEQGHVGDAGPGEKRQARECPGRSLPPHRGSTGHTPVCRIPSILIGLSGNVSIRIVPAVDESETKRRQG